MSGTFVVGFVPHHWSGPKVICGKCGRKVRSGTVHVHDQGDPPKRVLCHYCVRDIMENGAPEKLN